MQWSVEDKDASSSAAWYRSSRTRGGLRIRLPQSDLVLGEAERATVRKVGRGSLGIVYVARFGRCRCFELTQHLFTLYPTQLTVDGMAHYDRGTRFTNYSSIHSADAFVGDYQVMYTPGSTSPPVRERKPSRFRAPSRPQNATHSYVLPSNIPNTSQILPDRGTLQELHVQYKVPADEKQIVASLRSLQHDLNAAMVTIAEITRERDDAIHELRILRATSRKPSSPVKKRQQAARVEEELFDLSRLDESPKKTPARTSSAKRVTIGAKHTAKTTAENDARVLATIPINRLPARSPEAEDHVENKKAKASRDNGQHFKAATAANDTEQSFVAEDPTAASNTSRRRRHHPLDENMTSAYILPDITVAQQQPARSTVSKEAQAVLHDHDPQHVDDCNVCQRLTYRKQRQSAPKADYTAQVTALMKDIALEEATMRPKIPPRQALEHLKRLLDTQFQDAKRKHSQAWEEYDSIEAPLSSKKHASAGERMFYWSKKMEECRVNLDQLRDVEEGVIHAEES